MLLRELLMLLDAMERIAAALNLATRSEPSLEKGRLVTGESANFQEAPARGQTAEVRPCGMLRRPSRPHPGNRCAGPDK